MADDEKVSRTEMSIESIPATIHVADDQVEKFTQAGWTKVSHGRRRSSNPPTGSTPVQGR